MKYIYSNIHPNLKRLNMNGDVESDYKPGTPGFFADFVERQSRFCSADGNLLQYFELREESLMFIVWPAVEQSGYSKAIRSPAEGVIVKVRAKDFQNAEEIRTLREDIKTVSGELCDLKSRLAELTA